MFSYKSWGSCDCLDIFSEIADTQDLTFNFTSLQVDSSQSCSDLQCLAPSAATIPTKRSHNHQLVHYTFMTVFVQHHMASCNLLPVYPGSPIHLCHLFSNLLTCLCIWISPDQHLGLACLSASESFPTVACVRLRLTPFMSLPVFSNLCCNTTSLLVLHCVAHSCVYLSLYTEMYLSSHVSWCMLCCLSIWLQEVQQH